MGDGRWVGIFFNCKAEQDAGFNEIASRSLHLL